MRGRWMIGGVLCGLLSASALAADGEDRIPAGKGVRESSQASLPARHPMIESVVIKAREVHVGDGKVYRPGTIVLLGREIVAVGTDPGLPLTPRVVDLGDAVVTPGLVDAACQLGVHRTVGFAEQASEVIPHLDVADAIDFESKALETLAAEGVTTIYVTPEAASVIGSRGAVLKTGGAEISRLLDSSPSIKANLGPESMSRGGRNSTPSNFRGVTFMTRRPTTRMGSVWVFRKAFYDAMLHRDGKQHGEDPGAMAALVDVLNRKTSLRVQARKAHDIYTAQRLCDEFGIEGHVIEYGHESFRCLDLLAGKNTSVIYGPIFVNPTGLSSQGDRPRPCLTTPVQLREAGVNFCLTAADLSGEQGLARQAGLAIRYGLTRDEALQAVTSAPAAVLGIQEQVGLLGRGCHADLVAWSGDPLDDTSRVVLTLIDGQVAHDPEGRYGSEDE